MFNCIFCNKIITKIGPLHVHQKGCKLNPNKQDHPIWNRGRTKETDIRIKKSADKNRGKVGTFAGKKHTEETKKLLSILATGNKNSVGKVPWNKWQNKSNNQIIKEQSEKIKGKKNSFYGKTHSVESKAKMSQIASNRSDRGDNPGAGRGKRGWYKGYWCDSSWELAFVIYHLDHNIEIKRCTEYRYYVYENKKRKYYPDFIVNNQIYEIKGYTTKIWEAKHAQNSDIVCLFEKDMKRYIEYTIDKYGKDYIKLYDGKRTE